MVGVTCTADQQLEVWHTLTVSGAKVVAFTAHRTAPIPFADIVVRLPAQLQQPPSQPRAFPGSSPEALRALPVPSILPSGSAYQLALQLLLDTMATMYQHEHNLSEEVMRARQSNLE